VSESLLEVFRFDSILLINLIQCIDREFGYCGVYCSRPLPPSDAACLEANKNFQRYAYQAYNSYGKDVHEQIKRKL
jgi:hypothetical protein